MKINKLRNKLKEIKKIISLSPANQVLNKCKGKLNLLRRVFYIKPFERKQWVHFCIFMNKNNIRLENIYFTDESLFSLHAYLNKKKENKNPVMRNLLI